MTEVDNEIDNRTNNDERWPFCDWISCNSDLIQHVAFIDTCTYLDDV